MANIWTPNTIEWSEHTEKSTLHVSANKWIPKHLENKAQDILNETREKRLELKIEQIYIALENKYPKFERKNFNIKDAMLWESYDTYCLYWKQWQLLSYIKSDWETILDMENFKPFKDSLDKAFKNWVWIDYIKKDDWKWYLLLTNNNWKTNEYVEWSKKFNVAVTPD